MAATEPAVGDVHPVGVDARRSVASDVAVRVTTTVQLAGDYGSPATASVRSSAPSSPSTSFSAGDGDALPSGPLPGGSASPFRLPGAPALIAALHAPAQHGKIAFDPAEVLRLIEQQRVTVVFLSPHHEAASAEHQSAGDSDLSSLRLVRLDSPLTQRASIPAESVWNGGYGSSETFATAVSNGPEVSADVRRNTHGKPFPGTELSIVDPESGAVRPPDTVGDVAVRGRTLMSGYYKREPDDYLDENGFFRTGDLGFIDGEGYLHFLGRMSGMIKTGGANVSPVEVEAALQAWGGLRGGFVVGVPHPTLDEAVVVCATDVPGTPTTEEEVRSYLRGRLATYKVPKRVIFVGDEEVRFTAGELKPRPDALRALVIARLLEDPGLDPRWRQHLSQACSDDDRLAGDSP